MSYILDALKKAEKERDLGSVPDIDTVHEAAPARRLPWSWILSAVLAVNAAVIYLVFQKPSTTQSNQAEAPTPAQFPAELSATSPVLTAVPEIPTPTPVVASAPVTPAQSVTSDVPGASTPPAAPVKPVSMPPSVSPAEVSAEVPRPMTPIAAAEPVTVAPPPAKPVTPQEDASVPLLRDMPADFRQSQPPISVDVHVYGAKPEQRFVLINMRRYREGERISEGPLLESIIEDGVIMNAQGRRFRLSRQ